MDSVVKREILESEELPEKNRHLEVFKSEEASVVELSSSDYDSDESDDSDDDSGIVSCGKRSPNGLNGRSSKKQRFDNVGVVLPVGFLDPLPKEEPLSWTEPIQRCQTVAVVKGCKQFWKAGDYEGSADVDSPSFTGGMDHVRVHPKFLHSNATSHKWALGAFAELLDNSLDEICHGATYVNVDMLENKRDGSKMLLVEDNGGGMDPDKMRQCMSLGYSVKSKLANTIGQYGNGFKTSTMRLGADVIVFSRCHGQDGKRPTQTIGMLSYTFLRSTRKEDIVVPMVDYEKGEHNWDKKLRSSPGDWYRNLETIVQWSPYSSEADLLQQFNAIKDQGTRVIIYNLWEDDQGELELDFDTDQHDIQIRGVNRDVKKIKMAEDYPNSRHFLTYRHSLRSYASILYLNLPPGFQIILRGKEVEHHNIVNDMMLTQKITYRPQHLTDGVPKEQNVVAVVTIGFVKDAEAHIDIQGFNVYHKNRLIKPFWRVWNAAGSDGRGVIGVLEANFVEPAHDKQGFERTTVLSRLEARLLYIQKNYWSTNCHHVGYAPRRQKKHNSESGAKEKSPTQCSKKSISTCNTKDERMGSRKLGKASSSSEPTSTSAEDFSDDGLQIAFPERLPSGSSQSVFPAKKAIQKNGSHKSHSSPSSAKDEILNVHSSDGKPGRITTCLQSKEADINYNNNGHAPLNSYIQSLEHLEEENHELKMRLQNMEESALEDLLHELLLEKERCKSLETNLQEAEKKVEEMNKEQEALIDIFSEERIRRDNEEESLRKKLKAASNTIQELLNKVRLLEKIKATSCKPER